MRDIGCHYVTSERDSGNGKTAEKTSFDFSGKGSPRLYYFSIYDSSDSRES